MIDRSLSATNIGQNNLCTLKDNDIDGYLPFSVVWGCKDKETYIAHCALEGRLEVNIT